MITFTVTDEHIKLLKNAYVCWYDYGFGAPGIDAEKPYGNLWGFSDIADILGIQPQREDFTDEEIDRLYKIHRETEMALRIFISTGVMKSGKYQLTQINSKYWKEVGIK